MFKARDLVIADKNLLSKGGSSDPRVRLSIAGTAWTAASKVIKKSLEPVWKETFVVPLPHVDLEDWTKPQLTLQVRVSVRRDAFDAIRFTSPANAGRRLGRDLVG